MEQSPEQQQDMDNEEYTPGEGEEGEDDGEGIDLRELSPEQLEMFKKELMETNKLNEEQANEYIMSVFQSYEDMENDENEEMEGEEEGEEGTPPGQSQIKSPPEQEVDESVSQLDPSRKIKRDIVKQINIMREQLKITKMHRDYLLEVVAVKYAETMVANGKEEPELLKSFLIDGPFKCEVKTLTSRSNLEEGVSKNGEEMHKNFIDTHGLFVESEEGRQYILDPEINHIAIGCAHDDAKLYLVELYSKKQTGIKSIQLDQDQIVISAHMFSNTFGPYAFRLCDIANIKKDVLLLGPEDIIYDPINFNYSIRFKHPDALYKEKIGEIYLRKKPDSIPYGKKPDEKLSVDGLELGIRIPMEIIPLPQIIKEDAIDEENEEKEKITQQQKELELKEKLNKERDARLELRAQQAQEVIKEKEKEKDKLSKSISSNEEDVENKSKKSIDEEDKSVTSLKSKTISSKAHDKESKIDDEGKQEDLKEEEEEDENAKMQVELNREEEEKRKADAIRIFEQLREEKEKLIKRNFELQKEICVQLEKKNGGKQQPQTDTSMNEQKYINTLANVNQVRVELMKMQSKYNEMTSELNEKNKERSENAKKLLDWFKAFKSEIIREAEYSKTNKKIEKKIISQWEKDEEDLDDRIHKERLDNIMYKNLLKKNERDLKKREQLAEGLNLIDFEQLKIENQTLNEKIEERNEELHKLKKKIHNAVISITHIKEKLYQLKKKSELKEKKKEELEAQLSEAQKELNKEKGVRDVKNKEVQAYRKLVGFVHKNTSGGPSSGPNMKKVDLEAEHTRMSAELPLLKKREEELKIVKIQLLEIINKAKMITNK